MNRIAISAILNGINHAKQVLLRQHWNHTTYNVVDSWWRQLSSNTMYDLCICDKSRKIFALIDDLCCLFKQIRRYHYIHLHFAFSVEFMLQLVLHLLVRICFQNNTRTLVFNVVGVAKSLVFCVVLYGFIVISFVLFSWLLSFLSFNNTACYPFRVLKFTSSKLWTKTMEF